MGGDGGFLLGAGAAQRKVTSDPARLRRIDSAYRGFKADCLRKELAQVQGGNTFESDIRIISAYSCGDYRYICRT